MTIRASKLSTQLSNKSILPPFKRCSLNNKEKKVLRKKSVFKSTKLPDNFHEFCKIINSCDIIIMYFNFNIWIYISRRN
jgi:hypothetical protein